VGNIFTINSWSFQRITEKESVYFVVLNKKLSTS